MQKLDIGSDFGRVHELFVVVGVTRQTTCGGVRNKGESTKLGV